MPDMNDLNKNEEALNKTVEKMIERVQQDPHLTYYLAKLGMDSSPGTKANGQQESFSKNAYAQIESVLQESGVSAQHKEFGDKAVENAKLFAGELGKNYQEAKQNNPKVKSRVENAVNKSADHPGLKGSVIKEVAPHISKGIIESAVARVEEKALGKAIKSHEIAGDTLGNLSPSPTPKVQGAGKSTSQQR